MDEDTLEYNDSSYDLLVQNILNTPLLSNELQKLYERTKAVNLVCESWLENLKNYPVYKLHENKKVEYNAQKACGEEKNAFVRNIKDNKHIFDLIVAGEFKCQKSKRGDLSIVAKKCKALEEVGLVMKEDDSKILHPGVRCFVEQCHPLICSWCTKYHKMNNIPFAESNWCFLNLQIFDGESIVNIGAPLLQDILLKKSSFMAIFRINIQSRVAFKAVEYKICGSVSHMIVFQYSSLNIRKETLLPIGHSTTSAIEYPSNLIPDKEHEDLDEIEMQ